MDTQIILAELMHGHWATVELRRAHPDADGRVAVTAVADVPDALRAVAEKHGLPLVFELSTTVEAAGRRASCEIDLLVCDVVADMRRVLHGVIR